MVEYAGVVVGAGVDLLVRVVVDVGIRVINDANDADGIGWRLPIVTRRGRVGVTLPPLELRGRSVAGARGRWCFH
ncbi:hypothetical protein BST37_05210 [Mycobacterium noviomagense]|uniref:Uncharacterized protein n=1 Tax=Mycobacterium noviomagense TaxID=459858 RepID=A0ABX3T8W0_9MYCO|nr:hypothetical protein BST37_05210 [Mycobacterium noviomagense]